jgi:translocation and assembly module TamA
MRVATGYMYRVRLPFARAARWGAAVLCVAAIGAAATHAEQPQAPDEPDATVSTAASDDTTFAYEPTVVVDGGDEQVEAAVKSASLLFIYVTEPPDSVGVLFTRAKEDRQRIVRALNALGYFAPRTEITIAGGSIDDLANEDALAAEQPAGKISVEVKVAQGPLFTFGAVAVAAAPGSSTEPLALLKPDVTGLIAGEPARSAAVAAANERIVAALRQEGYPFATVVGREAIADHATSKLEVTFRVAPGPLAAFGDVAVTGVENMDADFMKELSPFESGERFKVITLNDYQRELERLSVFSSVAMNEAQSLDPQGRLPITVAVAERPLHVVGVSASWSTLEGAALGAHWTHRNLWGHAEQLRIDAQTARLLSNGTDDYEYGLGATLTFPATPARRDDLILTAAAKRERPEAYERDAALTEIRIRRRFDKTLQGEAAVGFTQSRETDALGTRDRSTIQVPLTLAYDTRDNILDATRGIRASAGVQPIVNLTRGAGMAGRFNAAASTYLALDEDSVLAGRLAVGVSAAAAVTDLPVDLRFFAGGGGSVRGYEFQALSPRNAINQIIGGRSLVEGSLELRSWLWDDVGVAAFADAGAASSTNVPEFGDIGVGVGLGVRYRTPVGPVRLDVAVPLDPPLGDPNYGVYVALGQAF